MNFKQGDIIVRNPVSNPTVWLSQRFVMEVSGVSEDFLRTTARKRYKQSVLKCYQHHDTLPDNGKSWRWAKIAGGFYYDLARIPNKKPNNYRELFGDAEALVQNYENSLKDKHISTLETMFKQHLKTNYRQYLEFYTEANEVQRPALAKACAVLDFILDNVEDYPGTKNKLYKDLEPILKINDLQYIPHHHIKLKEKVEHLMSDDSLAIVDVIQLPRTGNLNASAVADPEITTWVMQLRSMPQNFSNEHIIRKVQETCELIGKRVPSRRWFGQTILELPITKFLTSEKRFGSSSRKSQVVKSYIPFQNALFAGDCWEIDATRMNIISHEAEIQVVNKKGEIETKKVEKFIFVVAIRDVHSGDILGYSFDHSENHAVYAQAMKMAVQNAGYLPYEFVMDKFPGHNTPQMKDLFERMEHLGVKLTVTHKANDKAGVERFFRTLQSVFLMDSKYFYGEGIMSRGLAAHRSAEYIKKIKQDSKKLGWNLYQSIEESTIHLEKYRATSLSKYSRKHSKIHLSPKDLHEYCEKPHVTEVSQATISMLFGLRKPITIKQNGQFTSEMVGVEFDYMISPTYYDIISNYHGKQVVMTYDLEDLSAVFLWEKHGVLLKSLCEAELFTRPQRYGPGKDMSAVGRAKARAEAIQELKGKDLEAATSEENLMLGIHTDKVLANAAEDDFLNESYPTTYKKASGDDLSPDDLENSILNNLKY
jgi:hypothetical protein